MSHPSAGSSFHWLSLRWLTKKRLLDFNAENWKYAYLKDSLAWLVKTSLKESRANASAKSANLFIYLSCANRTEHSMADGFEVTRSKSVAKDTRFTLYMTSIREKFIFFLFKICSLFLLILGFLLVEWISLTRVLLWWVGDGGCSL